MFHFIWNELIRQIFDYHYWQRRTFFKKIVLKIFERNGHVLFFRISNIRRLFFVRDDKQILVRQKRNFENTTKNQSTLKRFGHCFSFSVVSN